MRAAPRAAPARALLALLCASAAASAAAQGERRRGARAHARRGRRKAQSNVTNAAPRPRARAPTSTPTPTPTHPPPPPPLPPPPSCDLDPRDRRQRACGLRAVPQPLARRRRGQHHPPDVELQRHRPRRQLQRRPLLRRLRHAPRPLHPLPCAGAAVLAGARARAAAAAGAAGRLFWSLRRAAFWHAAGAGKARGLTSGRSQSTLTPPLAPRRSGTGPSPTSRRRWCPAPSRRRRCARGRRWRRRRRGIPRSLVVSGGTGAAVAARRPRALLLDRPPPPPPTPPRQIPGYRFVSMKESTRFSYNDSRMLVRAWRRVCLRGTGEGWGRRGEGKHCGGPVAAATRPRRAAPTPRARAPTPLPPVATLGKRRAVQRRPQLRGHQGLQGAVHVPNQAAVLLAEHLAILEPK
jgi:hypothetical protein